MKATLFFPFIALLMVGCGSPDLDDPETLEDLRADAIDRNKLQKRGKEGEESSGSTNPHRLGKEYVWQWENQIVIIIPIQGRES